LSVGALVVVLTVVLALSVGRDPEADTRSSRLLGTSAPSFDLPTLTGPALTGPRVTSAALLGRSVIVNFWNTWCIPCRQEHTALQTFYRRHRDDSDFVMIGIVRDDKTSAVRSYVQSQQVEWVVALDPGAKAALEFGTRGQPETYAISPSGQIVGAEFGPMTLGGLEAMLARARAD
jgi:cytochrome c biogenesis protein CcmG/thiol:disulfide interchange protein DsbE